MSWRCNSRSRSSRACRSIRTSPPCLTKAKMAQADVSAVLPAAELMAKA